MRGRRIVITRPPHKAATLADSLRALGAEPIILPTIAIEPVEDASELDRALQQAYDWAIFTSPNAVAHVWRRFAALEIAPRLPPRLAAVGTATAQSLREQGYEPDLIPPCQTAEGLYAALIAHYDLRGRRVFLPQGDLARPYLANHLRAAGAQVTSVVAYRNVRPIIDEALLALPFDAITFTSASTVQNFVDLFDNPLEVIGSAQVVCIGPVTAQAAQDKGLPVHCIAEPHSIEGLMTALYGLFQGTSLP